MESSREPAGSRAGSRMEKRVTLSEGGLLDVPLSHRAFSPEGSVQIEIDDGYYQDEYTPVMGPFGAPPCRCSSAVLALTAMMIGMILFTAGGAITVFLATQEELVTAPGLTLIGIGVFLFLLGCFSWTSQFMCHDCISRIHAHMKKAPVKEAQRRRAKRMSRMSGCTDSRLNSQLGDKPISRTASRTTVTSEVKY